MIKLYLGSIALLTIGLMAGIMLSGQSSEVASDLPAKSSSIAVAADREDLRTRVKVAELEAQLADLNIRLTLLEAREPANPEPDISSSEPENIESMATGFASEPVAVVDGLIAAGLDSFTAEQIARRISESDLMTLELRDKAIREGYIGSQQYREEMMAARQDRVSVRDEIDESTYDRYLYFSGQSNRIAVSTVMLGSAAENSGIEAGDVLLRYEDKALYKTGDIRGLTSQGERSDIVDVTLLRNGNQMMVSVPRGPLGVRLSPIRIAPAGLGSVPSARSN